MRSRRDGTTEPAGRPAGRRCATVPPRLSAASVWRGRRAGARGSGGRTPASPIRSCAHRPASPRARPPSRGAAKHPAPRTPANYDAVACGTSRPGRGPCASGIRVESRPAPPGQHAPDPATGRRSRCQTVSMAVIQVRPGSPGHCARPASPTHRIARPQPRTKSRRSRSGLEAERGRFAGTPESDRHAGSIDSFLRVRHRRPADPVQPQALVRRPPDPLGRRQRRVGRRPSATHASQAITYGAGQPQSRIVRRCIRCGLRSPPSRHGHRSPTCERCAPSETSPSVRTAPDVRPRCGWSARQPPCATLRAHAH